jgi:tRNA(adenine34) deaminase
VVFPSDEAFMQRALSLAETSAELGEVPVGAVVVSAEGEILSVAHNSPISSIDPTAHAEVSALRGAARAVNNYRLVGCTLYVTLEPCMMCYGAMIHARIARLVYGASEPRAGVVQSQLQAPSLPFFNHTFTVTGGVLGSDCSAQLKRFFKQRRR